MDKWSLVEVTWHDAQGPSDCTNSLDFLRKFKPCIRLTVGYYLGVKDDYTFIASTDDRQSEVGDHVDCTEINAIPTAMIQTTHILRRGRRA